MRSQVIGPLAFGAMCLPGGANAALFDWMANLFGAQSVDYGAWECTACNIPAQGQPGDNADLAEIAAFIYANNPEIHNSKNESVDRWVNKSTITVCDSDSCLQVMYTPGRGSIGWFPTAGTTARGSRTVKTPQPAGSFPEKVSVSPVGPDEDDYHGQYTIELPFEMPTPERVGSVTVIENPGSTIYIGDTDLLPLELEPQIGEFLDWGYDSYGLEDYWRVCY